MRENKGLLAAWKALEAIEPDQFQAYDGEALHFGSWEPHGSNPLESIMVWSDGGAESYTGHLLKWMNERWPQLFLTVGFDPAPTRTAGHWLAYCGKLGSISPGARTGETSLEALAKMALRLLQ